MATSTATGKCATTSTGYTGPTCLPGDADAEDHADCIDDIGTADISDIPDLPSGIKAPVAPTVNDVTTEVIAGTGAFDSFMRAGSNQLQSQYDAGRIKGAEYAQAYIAMMQLMMEQANMFVIKKFEAETAGAMFHAQYMTAAFGALTAEHSANKMIADAYLTSIQACELPINGSQDRILKAEQAKAQSKTVDLYDRQSKGFDEKNTEGIFKIIMDSWAAQGVEITSTQTDSVLNILSKTNVGGIGLDERVAKMMDDNGITG